MPTKGIDAVSRLRAICMAFPEVTERLSHGAPTWFVRHKTVFRPPYVGHRGWLGVRMDGEVDWAEIAELCEDAYRVVAPKRLVAQLDDEVVP